MSSFFTTYWDVLAFYALVGILLYVFRKKFEFHGIVALLRTKLGLEFMERTGKRAPRFWHHVGLGAIVLGFIGMVFITIYLFYGLYALFFIPNAPATLSPVIPGVKIPGVPIIFPLWYTLFGLFLAVVIHEASHGIWSAAYNIRIKSSGFAFFGPLPGAFVEPDEKVMTKRPRREQLAIMAAGPFSNMILAILAFLLVVGFGTLASTLTNDTGVYFTDVAPTGAAFAAGMSANNTITAIDGNPIHNTQELSNYLDTRKPNDVVLVTTTTSNYQLTLKENPNEPGDAFMGVLGVTTTTELKNPSMNWLYAALIIAGTAFLWTYIISLGLGIANLLPIGPVDGGRMFLIALTTVLPEKKAVKVWTRWSAGMLIIVLVLVLLPIIKAVLA